MDKLVIDHNDEKTLRIVLNEGAWAAISTCFDKLTPREVALIIKELLKRNEELDRVIVNSEYGWGYQGYFSVPRIAFEAKLLGIKRSEIEKITFENPIKLFRLKL